MKKICTTYFFGESLCKVTHGLQTVLVVTFLVVGSNKVLDLG